MYSQVAPTRMRTMVITTKEMTTCFLESKYAQDVKLVNILMTSILNQRLVHISGVGDEINATFINPLKRSIKRVFLAVLKISEALPLKN